MIHDLTPVQLCRGFFVSTTNITMRMLVLTILACWPLLTGSGNIVAGNEVGILPDKVSAERVETEDGNVQLRLAGPTMGTYFSIIVDSPPGNLSIESLQTKIASRLADINHQMSTWEEDSEISKFNKTESTDWFEVSAEFATVVTEAKRIHELTRGAFDPTVSPLIDLWGFGDARDKTMPDGAEIAAAQKSVGMRLIEVREKPPAIKKQIAELQLNLSAIAKGYGVDALAQLLVNEGLESFVVDIGGENKTGAPKVSGELWKVGVESPLGGLQRIVELSKSSIATSGDYRNYFEMNGETYSHAIDPKTGWPVKNPPASISVIHESCMTADAWATAMMVLGVEKGSAIAKANQLSVVFQNVSNGSVAETTTGLFAIDSAAKTIAAESSDATPAVDKPKANGAPWFPFAAAAVIFLIAIAGMAVGTILQNRSIKGSCGGLASMPGSEGKSICELCTIPKDQCTNAELREQMQTASADQCDDNS